MLLDEVGSYLQTQGLGTVGSTIYKGWIPPVAANAVLGLIEVPGLPPLHVHDVVGPSIEQPVLQVLTRGEPEDYAPARLRAQDAFVALASVHNQILSGVAYVWIVALQNPFFLRWDDYNRPVIAFNIRCGRSSA